MPQTARTATPTDTEANRSAYAGRDRADAASDSAIQAAANSKRLRDAAAKTNTAPDVPMTDSERQGGLVGAAAYSKRKRKALEDWRATQVTK